MKKIFTLLMGCGLVWSANAQLLVDDFNYTGDLAANGWTIHSGTADPILTTTGLTFPGYPGSGVGNAANVIGAGYDYNKGFANQTGNGTVVWLSAMLKVTDAAANTGGYFLHLGDRNDTDPTNFTLFTARIFAKTDNAGNVNFGISNTSTGTFGTTNFSTNTTYLAVVKYTINTGGSDDVSLWILSGSTPSDEASLGTPEMTATNAGTDNVDAIGIRQASSIPDVVVDGIRIGNTFTGTVLPLQLTSFQAILNGSKAMLIWNTTNESKVKGFAVEKSLNGVDFSEIAFVNATNNITSNNYSVEDSRLKAGANYYRIKMMDIDGSYKYSNVVLISNKSGIKTELYPNPVVNTLTVSHDKTNANAVIRIMSIEGKQVLMVPVKGGVMQTSINVSDLKKGNYLMVFESNGDKSTSIFTRQ